MPETASAPATTIKVAQPSAQPTPPLRAPASAPTQALTLQPAHASAHPPAAANTAGSVGGMLLALALVLTLIFGLAWLARRMPGLAAPRRAGLRVVTALPLGARERLLVVEVGQQQLLLASGASGTRLLHTLAQPLPEPPATNVPLPSAFAQVLARQFGKQTP